jgi:hypothetical protein
VAVTLFMRIPELDLERYDEAMGNLRLDSNPPAGMILHIASESVGSVNVLEVWQTAQAAESFVETRLRDALIPLRIKDPLSYRLEPLHNLYAADLDMIERIGATSMRPGSARSELAS